MAKLSTAQRILLQEFADVSPAGKYVVDHYPPLRKLLELGLVRKLDHEGWTDRYAITVGGFEALGVGPTRTSQPMEVAKARVPADEITAAFLDVMDGNSKESDIHHITGHSRSRCEAISELAGRLFREYECINGVWVKR